MTNHHKLLWAGGGLLLAAFLVVLGLPSLVRSRLGADEAYLLSKSRREPESEAQGKLALSAQVAVQDRKLILNSELGLLVGNVRSVAEEIRRLTELNHGEIDKLEIVETGDGSMSASLLVRVPASGLGNAIADFKKLAIRTEREQMNAHDVTREFYDNEAHLRNLRAEEQQYLAIMKQAGTIEDTLNVAEKLSDVRDRIERLQTQIQVMTHDIDMSLVTISLAQESEARVMGLRWRPLYNAKNAVRELLAGLGEWLDWVVAALVKLPLILLWAATVGGMLLVGWKMGRWAWLRCLRKEGGTR